MKEEYKIRHKILEHLYSKIKFDDEHVPDLSKSIASLIELSEATNTPLDKIVKYHHGIPDNQAICRKNHMPHSMMMLRDGIDAYIDRYWLKLGRKEMNDSIYDVTKWIAPVLALVISIITFLYTKIELGKTKNKVSELESTVIKLNNEKIQLNDRVKNLTENLTNYRMTERIRFVDSLIFSKEKK